MISLPSFNTSDTALLSYVSASDEGFSSPLLRTEDLQEFDKLSPAVQHLLVEGLELSTENLAYTYGSDDPKNGGMDCSGTVYHLLNDAGLTDVPRDSAGLYTWVWKKGLFQAVVSSNPNSFEFARLKPGDLLFWTGTYKINRDPPVTHVMLYLGTNRLTGRRVMVGASQGRTFNGKPRYGVSVFDFKLPGASADAAANPTEARFIGYASIPGLETATPSPAKSPTNL